MLRTLKYGGFLLNTLYEFMPDIAIQELPQAKRNFLTHVSFKYFVEKILFRKTLRVRDIPANIEDLHQELNRVLNELQNFSIGDTLSENAITFYIAFHLAKF